MIQTGIALLFDLIRRDRPAHAQVEIRALAPNLAALVRGYDPKDFVAPARGRRPMGMLEHIGRATAEQIAYLRQMGRFLGACATALRHALAGRVTIRWSDVLDVATEAADLARARMRPRASRR